MLVRTNNTLVEEEPPRPVGTRRLRWRSLAKSVDNKNANLTETQIPAHWGVDEEEENETLEATPQVKPVPGLRHIPKIAAPLTFLVLLGLWQLLTAMAVYPAYILPAPAAVAERWFETAQSGALWRHTQVTLLEAGLGFGAALLVVSLLAYPLAHSRLVSALLSPLLAATQAVPLVALAPLLVIWFGFGLTPKIITCALIVFFPLLLNAVAGLRSVDKSLKEAAAVFGASRWQTLWLVELPLSMPSLLTGVKIGFTVAFTGAVVGEFISSDAGLGYLLNLGRGQFDTPMVFVALLTLTVIAMLAYGLVGTLEKLLLRWQ